MIRSVTIVFVVFGCCLNIGDTLRPPRRRTSPKPSTDVEAHSQIETRDSLPVDELAIEAETSDATIFAPEIPNESELIPSRRKLLQRRGRKPPSERRRHVSTTDVRSKHRSSTPNLKTASSFSRRKQAIPSFESKHEAKTPPRRNRPPFRSRKPPTTKETSSQQATVAETDFSAQDTVSQRFGSKRRNRPFPRTKTPVASSVFRPTTSPDLPMNGPLRDLSRLEKIEKTFSTQTQRSKFTENSQTAAFSSPKTNRPSSRRTSSRRKVTTTQSTIRAQGAGVTTEKITRPTSAPELPRLADYETECPEKNGVFADAFQCDRYYECSNFELKEKICPDGLVFNDFSTELGRCDFMHAVNCSGREQLQPPHPVGICPRRNGYYPDADPAVCDRFVQCVGGKANPLVCPAGLVFSLSTGTCLWPDQAGRTGCGSKEVLQFQCPYKKPIDIRSLLPGQPLHPRFPDPNDCQFFITCIEGSVPRRHGCQQGRVFNAESSSCDDPENVPECNGSLDDPVQ